MRTNLSIVQGEYARVEFAFDADEPAPWSALPPETVITLRIASWEGGAVRRTVAGSLDAPGADGSVRSGGAAVPLDTPSGLYDVELEVGAPSVGFPRVALGTLRVLARQPYSSGTVGSGSSSAGAGPSTGSIFAGLFDLASVPAASAAYENQMIRVTQTGMPTLVQVCLPTSSGGFEWVTIQQST